MTISTFDSARTFRQRVAECCGDRLSRVVVFGSRARGDATEESDLDVLVLLKEDDDALRRRIWELAYDVGLELDCPFPIQALVMTEAHFAELRRLERRIALDIEREGVAV